MDANFSTTASPYYNASACNFQRSAGQTIFMIVRLIYMTPSVVYIKFLLFAMICGRHRQRYVNILYRLILIAALSTIVVDVPYTLIQLLQRFGSAFCTVYKALSTPTYALMPFHFLYNAFEMNRIWIGIIIVIMRTHAYINPIDSESMWQKYRWAVFFFLLLIPFAVMFPLLAKPGYWSIKNGQVEFDSVQLWSWYAPQHVFAAIFLIGTVIAVGSEITLCACGKLKPRSMVNNVIANVGLAYGLILMIDFVCWVLNGIAYHRVPEMQDAMVYIMMVASDAYGLLPLWVLYFSSPDVREDATPRCFSRCRQGKKGGAAQQVVGMDSLGVGAAPRGAGSASSVMYGGAGLGSGASMSGGYGGTHQGGYTNAGYGGASGSRGGQSGIGGSRRTGAGQTSGAVRGSQPPPPYG